MLTVPFFRYGADGIALSGDDSSEADSAPVCDLPICPIVNPMVQIGRIDDFIIDYVASVTCEADIQFAFFGLRLNCKCAGCVGLHDLHCKLIVKMTTFNPGVQESSFVVTCRSSGSFYVPRFDPVPESLTMRCCQWHKPH